MQEWKLNQEIYNNVFSNFSDSYSNFINVSDPDIVGVAVEYFSKRPAVSKYPGKSYAVAIIYAKTISDRTGEDFYELLKDPELLYNNDPYFVPYGSARDLYDRILDQLGGLDSISMEGGWAFKTREYCLMECFGEHIDEEFGT